MSIIETTFISISQQYIYGTIPFTKTNWCLDYKLNPEKDYPKFASGFATWFLPQKICEDRIVAAIDKYIQFNDLRHSTV